MKITAIIKTVNRNLWHYKLRSFLTIAAVFIGAFTLTMTNGFGDGLRDFIEKNAGLSNAANILIVHPKFEIGRGRAGKGTSEQIEYQEPPEGEDFVGAEDHIKMYSEENFRQLVAGISHIQTVAPDFSIKGEYLTIEDSKKFSLIAVAQNISVSYALLAGEAIKGEREIVLPFPIAKAINADTAAVVGKTAQIAFKNQQGEVKIMSVTVIGIAPENLFGSIGTYLDLKTAREVYSWQKESRLEKEQFFTFFVKTDTDNPVLLDKVKQEFNNKNFEAVTLAERQQTIFTAINLLKLCLNGFAVIALLAASCGIVNTLVIAVLERTKEIGLSKALGMSSWKIFMMFTLESIFVGLWGTILGIISAFVAGSLITHFIVAKFGKAFENYQLVQFSAFSLFSIILLVSLLALLAGAAPAWRASRLDPIDALKDR